MVMAFVVPCYSAEMKINGINRLKFVATDNMDGNKKIDDNRQFVKQRLRMYFTSIASENLKVVYKNEIDFNWGDSGASYIKDDGDNQHSRPPSKGKGGGVGGDVVNLETKNIYMEMMVPNTPLKFTGGLQGITMHRGWMISDDIAAAKFDVNLDPFSVMAYWAIASDTNFSDSSDDVQQFVLSGSYKAENMNARLSLGYEKGQNDRENDAFNTDHPISVDNPERVDTGIKDDDFYIVMADFGMSFDMVSFYLIGGFNGGKQKGTSGVSDKKYKGSMLEAQVDFALDIATLYVNFRYASGEKESKDDFGWRGLTGTTYSWAEIVSDGYFWEVNSDDAAIGGANNPSNMMAFAIGGDVKPTDTTSIGLDMYYISMVEKRTVGGKKTDDYGFEIDLDVTQKVYDNLDVKVVGAIMFADDGYGDGSKDDGWVLGMGMNYKF